MYKKTIALLCCAISYNLESKTLVNVKRIIPTIKIDLKYATSDNFVHQVVYDFGICYLLEPVANALKKVQQELALQGLGLKIWDGYRTMQAQHTFWQICPDPRYVSDPNKEMGRHTRGTAVDVTLVDLKTDENVQMPTEFDNFTEQAAPDYQGASKVAKKHRAILQHAMYKHGFTNNKTEWWHFDYQGWQDCPPLNIIPHDEDEISI